MKENIQRNIYDYLQKKGIENFIGVPDSTLKHFVDQGLKKNKIIDQSIKIEDYKKENNILDVWFDSGSMPYAQLHYPFENKALIDEKKY